MYLIRTERAYKPKRKLIHPPSGSQRNSAIFRNPAQPIESDTRHSQTFCAFEHPLPDALAGSEKQRAESSAAASAEDEADESANGTMGLDRVA